MNRSEWMHDWNANGPMAIAPGTHVMLNDETLRDGLQNPSIQDPTIEEKIEILHLMESLGIDSVNIGLPGAGPRAVQHVEALAREIATNRMRIRPNCAPSRKFHSAPASPSRPQHFWDRARSAGWWKTGLWTIWNAPPKRP